MSSGYRKFVTELNQLCSLNSVESFPTCLVLHGSEDFFVRSSASAYSSRWKEISGGEVLRHGDLHDGIDWSILLGQTGLFSSSSLHVFRVSDLRKLPAMLKKISSAQAHASFCLMVTKEELGKSADQIGPKGKIVGCSPPAGAEMRGFIQALGNKHGLRLNLDAAEFVLSMLGEDYQLISNEVEKLGLILADLKGTEIGHQEIAPLLGFLRDDHAFKISDLLIEGKISEAELLVRSLLEKGESALALLGILARHIRMIIYHTSAPGKNLSNDGTMRLPSWLRVKYEQLARKQSIRFSIRMNRMLQSIDASLKTNRVSEHLAMTELFSELRCSAN
jgi:DNA polymerase III delta subunit